MAENPLKIVRRVIPALAGLLLVVTSPLAALVPSDSPPPLVMSFSYAPVPRPGAARPTQDKRPDDGGDQPARRPPAFRPNTGRGLFEMGIIMSYSQARYWLNYAKFIEDWQYHLSWNDQRRRFFTFEAWKFDSNAFSLNWTHSFAGVLYYQFGRTNGLSWRKSFLFSLGGSLWWEYVAEWREVISLNDNIMTALGGFAAGEAWYQLGKYFIGRRGIVERVLSFAVDPLLKFNHWLDLRKGYNRSLGPEPGWHDFQLFVGQKKMPTSSMSGPQRNLYVGFHTSIIHAPEYGLAGRSDRRFSDTIASDLDVDFALRHGRIEEFNFATRVACLGWYWQDIGPDRRGHAYYFGLGSAFSLFKKKAVAFYDSSAVTVKQGFDLELDKARQFTDKIAVVHAAGPVFDFTSFTPKTRLRLTFEGYLDFGLINSFALNPYSEDEDISGVKSTLLYYGYYYGFGTTFSSKVKYLYRGLQTGAGLRYSAYGSIEGLDRYQYEIMDDFHLTDQRFVFHLEAGFRLPGVPVELSGKYETINRHGAIKDVVRRNIEDRFSFRVSYVF